MHRLLHGLPSPLSYEVPSVLHVLHIPTTKSPGCEDVQVSHGSGSAQAAKAFRLRLCFAGFSPIFIPQNLGALGDGRGHHLNSHLYCSPLCCGTATVQCFPLESILDTDCLLVRLACLMIKIPGMNFSLITHWWLCLLQKSPPSTTLMQ